MSEKKISIYQKITDTKSQNTFTIDDFLTGVKNGHWQDCVLQVRAGKKDKKECQAVTVAGVFEERKDNKLKQHSGFVAVDIDYKDFKDKYTTDQLKEILCKDSFTFSCFISIGGYGLVVIVKIDPRYHREIFRSLENYYFETYGISIDSTSVNESRPRFVSYDNELHRNDNAKKYTHRLKPKIEQKKYSIPFANSDVEHCIQQIQENGIDITGDYPQWRDIGMALANQYGESGRDFFIVVSQNSPKFNESYAHDQYTKYCRHDDKWAGNKITISSFFRYCKLYGVDITDKTKQITAISRQKRKGKANKDEVKEQITKSGIANNDDGEALQIVDQVYNEKANEVSEDDLTQLEKEELFLKTNYNLEFNELTQNYENNREEMTDRDINEMYRKARHEINDKINFDKFFKLIHSGVAKPYHPLREYVQKLANKKSRNQVKGSIKKLFDFLPTDTGGPGYKDRFTRKFMIGLVAGWFGIPNEIWLHLVGRYGGTGKSYFCRNFLPPDLKKYISETDFLQGKDDQILMCTSGVVFDDEIQGKTKDQEEKLKSFATKDEFTVRLPFGRKALRLKRAASLIATSNDHQILTDVTTKNRRYVPLNVCDYMDIKKFNVFNKDNPLIEAYYAFKDGEEFRITREEVEWLNECTEEFKAPSMEGDAIWRYFRKPMEGENVGIEYLTTTDIKAYCEDFGMKNLSVKKIGTELRNNDFERVSKNKRYTWKVVKTGG